MKILLNLDSRFCCQICCQNEMAASRTSFLWSFHEFVVGFESPMSHERERPYRFVWSLFLFCIIEGAVAGNEKTKTTI